MALATSNARELNTGNFQACLEEDKDPSLLAFMGWAIWNRHNQIRFNEVACPLNQLL